MPPAPKRKPHSKSRKGCLQCKQRHTKSPVVDDFRDFALRNCTETHPQCANCIRLDIECTWPAASSKIGTFGPRYSGIEYPVSKLQQHSNRSSNQSTPDPTPIAPLALDDLKLLHHWTATVSWQHSSALGSEIRLWSVDIVNIAFDHPFLLRALLATSAIHRSFEVPPADRASLLAQADAHMSTSLIAYRHNLINPTLETALSMFLFSSMIVTYNLASAQVQEPERPIDALVHCFRLLRGVKVVIGPYWEEIRKSPILSQMLDETIKMESIPIPNDGRFTEISDLNKLCKTHLNNNDFNTCVMTVMALHKTFVGIQMCEDERHEHSVFMTWPALLSDEYMDLLVTHDPVAVIIVAHFSVLMARARAAWWLKGWPERIIDAAMRLLEPTPELRVWLDWPMKQIQAAA